MVNAFWPKCNVQQWICTEMNSVTSALKQDALFAAKMGTLKWVLLLRQDRCWQSAVMERDDDLKGVHFEGEG